MKVKICISQERPDCVITLIETYLLFVSYPFFFLYTFSDNVMTHYIILLMSVSFNSSPPLCPLNILDQMSKRTKGCATKYSAADESR